MRWLISTDGSSRAQVAARFVIHFLRPEEDEVTLLGIADGDAEATIAASIEMLRVSFGTIPTQILIKSGNMAEVIEQIAREQTFDVALYASRGRRGLTKLLFGSVAAELGHEISCSLLVVRGAPSPIKRILICTTLDENQMAPITLGGQFAQRVQARVTVLHVMSQIPLIEDAPEDPLKMTAEEAIEKQTREGQRFTQILAHFAAQNITAQPVIRHGLVVDEVLAEVLEGDYDLLVLGAHAYSIRSRFQSFLVEDVTNAILLNTRCPVLIAR